MPSAKLDSSDKKKNKEKKDGGEIGGSRVNFPLYIGETPTQSTEEQSEQPTVPQRLRR